MAADLERIESILAKAIHLSAQDRSEMLDSECGDDCQLRQHVEERLAEIDAETSEHQLIQPDESTIVLDESAHEPGSRRDDAVTGKTVIAGRYVLDRQIGQGGMGEVWSAHQREPVKREVALKLIKTGMDTKAVLSRFEAERQALAMMDHPGIARVLDGGMTEAGQPYFVMELVDGKPLNVFCNEARFTPRQRLELFISICQAVQHAHQKGIVHRDLKPANILVTALDGQPAPKVIDFGLAKALEEKLTDDGMSTHFGMVLGTLEYMSPEQAGFAGSDVDTRADVYSLGVILYELLTGLKPLAAGRLKEVGLAEIIRIIQEEVPVRPSVRLSSDDSLASQAALRQTEPRKLSLMLRGELDWVVLKCLEKQRERRYQTVNGLARDIERYLADEPIEARPPSKSYRLGKFFKRNRLPVIAASLVLLAMVGGIIGTSWGLYEARQARDAESARATSEQRAKEQAQTRLAQIERGNQILTSVFEDFDIRAYNQDEDRVEVVLANRLINAGRQLNDEAVGDPRAVAIMQNRLGKTLVGLGYAEEASELLERSYAASTGLLGPVHEETLSTLNNLAGSYRAAGQLDKALPLFEQAVAEMQSSLGLKNIATLKCMNNLAECYQTRGELDQAVGVYEQTLDAMRGSIGVEHPETLLTMTNLATVYLDLGRTQIAMPLIQETLQLSTSTLGPRHPNTLATMHNLATGYLDVGDYRAALPLLEQTFELRKVELGSDHPETLFSMSGLAAGYQAIDDLDRAIPLYEETLTLMNDKLGEEHFETLVSAEKLAGAYRKVGRLGDAIDLYEATLERSKRILGDEHPQTLDTQASLAATLDDAGQLDRALRLLEQTLQQRRAKLGENHPNTVASLGNLASHYESRGNLGLALPLLKETHERMTVARGAEHPTTVRALSNLASGYFSAKEFEKALPLFEQSLELQETLKGPDHSDTLNVMNNLAMTYQMLDQSDKALAMYETLVDRMEGKLPQDHPLRLTIVSNLATIYDEAGQLDRALPMYEATLELRRATLGSDHPDTLVSMNNLATGYFAAGQAEKALPLMQETLEMMRAKLGDEHPNTIKIRNNLARCYRSAGEPDKAGRLYEELVGIHERTVGRDDLSTLIALANQGASYRLAARNQESLSILEEAYRGLLDADHSAVWGVGNELIKAYLEADEPEPVADIVNELQSKIRTKLPPEGLAYAGNLAELASNLLRDAPALAEPVLRESLAILDKEQPDAWLAFDLKSALGEALMRQQKWADAEPLLLEGRAGLVARSDTIPAQIRDVRISLATQRLVGLYQEWHEAQPDEGHGSQAEEWQQQLERLEPMD